MIKEAVAINKKNRNTLWQDAIQKSWKKWWLYSKLYLRVRSHPLSFSMSPATWCLTLQWRISIERHDKWWEARWPIPQMLLPAPVWSKRKTVHNALTKAALHDQEVKAADVLDSYVMAPNRGKIWIIICLKLDDAGRSAIIVGAVYSLKSTGASHWAHLAELGCQSCDADTDLWMKVVYRLEDKLQFYSYIPCYVDDILCIHYDPDDVLNKLKCMCHQSIIQLGVPICSWTQSLSECNYVKGSWLGLWVHLSMSKKQ